MMLENDESMDEIPDAERMCPSRLELAKRLQSSYNIILNYKTLDSNGNYVPIVDKELVLRLKQVDWHVNVGIKCWLRSRVQRLKEDDNCEEVLEEILSQINCSDYAEVLYDVGGLEALSDLLQNPDDDLRARAADGIRICCENNPVCRHKTSDDEVIGRLVEMSMTDNSTEARISAVAALSEVISNNQKGINIFRRLDGLELLKKGLNGRNFDRNICLIIRNVCIHSVLCKEKLVRMGVVEKLMDRIESCDRLVLESVLWGALESISQDCCRAVNLLRTSEARLIKIEEKLQEKCKGDADYKETSAAAKEVLDRVQGKSSSDN